MANKNFIFPQRPESAYALDGYVYVIEFDNGTVKVGQTQNPAIRLEAHRRASNNFGVSIENYYLSDLHRGHEGTETALIKHAQKISGSESQPGEYFTNIKFSDCVDFIKGLPLRESTTEEQDRDAAITASNLSALKALFTEEREGLELFPVYVDSKGIAHIAATGLDPRFSIDGMGGGIDIESEEATSALNIIQEYSDLSEDEALNITTRDFMNIGIDLLAQHMKQNIELKFIKAGNEAYYKKYFKKVA